MHTTHTYIHTILLLKKKINIKKFTKKKHKNTTFKININCFVFVSKFKFFFSNLHESVGVFFVKLFTESSNVCTMTFIFGRSEGLYCQHFVIIPRRTSGVSSGISGLKCSCLISPCSASG